MAARITAADLDTLAARLERAMLARGVFNPPLDGHEWHLYVSKGSTSYSRSWELWFTDDKGSLAYVPGTSGTLGKTAREAHAVLSALVEGLRMVRAQDVHGYALRDEAIAADK
jgi:hypothetical protein